METNNYDQTSAWLKPCPFCGGTPIYHWTGNALSVRRKITIQCYSCNVKMELSRVHQTDEWLMNKAITKWNKRA